MRTAHRILAPAGLAGAAQNAPVGHAGLWISAHLVGCPTVACSWEVAAALVPTRRLAPVEGQSAPLSPALGPQSAVASPSSTRGGLAPLSSPLSHYLARLLFTLVDHPLASLRIFVLKLCSGSCCEPRSGEEHEQRDVPAASSVVTLFILYACDPGIYKGTIL